MPHQEHRPSQSHDPLIRGPAARRAAVMAAPSGSASRSIGFRTSPQSSPADAVIAEPRSRPSEAGARGPGSATATPTPLPKRPKGSYFLGAAFLTVLLISALAVWNTYFRYNAYGMISGRIIEVPASQAGTIRSIHVREGEVVSSGQLLAIMEDPDSKAELDRLHDELAIAQATLDAKVAELSWQSRLREDQTQRTLADYYESWGTLLKEEAELSNMQLQLKRKEEIVRAVPKVITEEELETLRFAIQGQHAKVDKLTAALEKLRKLISMSGPTEGPQQLRPQLSRIKSLQEQIARARQRLESSELRSPASGRVIAIHFFAGEYVLPETPVLDILEDGSLKAVLYLPQRKAQSLAKGDIIDLDLVANAETLCAEVTGFGEQMVAPPPTLQRYYRSNETLLEVFARPRVNADGLQGNKQLRLGSEVRLPDKWVKRSEPRRTERRPEKRQITKTDAEPAPAPAPKRDASAAYYESAGPSYSQQIQGTAYETAIPRTGPRLRRPVASGSRSKQARRLPPDPGVQPERGHGAPG